MGEVGMVKTAKVDLIPWNPNSADHVQRMVDQRVACGWRSHEVPSWVGQTNEGNMNMYWLVLSDSLPDHDNLLSRHLARFPNESSPLNDTSTTTFSRPRTPTLTRPFHPIGHIALQFPPQAELSALSPSLAAAPGGGAAYICRLYVSWAAQSSGLGGTAIRAVEALARDAFGARTAYLDTMAEEAQMRPDRLRDAHEALGYPVPMISNEAWYVKMGYQQFLRKEQGYLLEYPAGESGQIISEWVPSVYFKKALH